MTAAIEVRRFDTPDDILDMAEAGSISVIRMADGTAGMRAVFEPGWTWERDEKPLLGSPETCPARHTGYCIGGRLVVQMVEAQAETRIGPGDFFEIPPGHHAYVDGDERVELILFAPSEHVHYGSINRTRGSAVFPSINSVSAQTSASARSGLRPGPS